MNGHTLFDNLKKVITSELGQQKGVLPTLSNGGIRVEKGAIY